MPERAGTCEVRCTHCGGRYDLTAETVHRYADCTLFIAPCCGRKVDDREFLAFCVALEAFAAQDVSREAKAFAWSIFEKERRDDA